MAGHRKDQILYWLEKPGSQLQNNLYSQEQMDFKQLCKKLAAFSELLVDVILFGRQSIIVIKPDESPILFIQFIYYEIIRMYFLILRNYVMEFPF